MPARPVVRGRAFCGILLEMACLLFVFARFYAVLIQNQAYKFDFFARRKKLKSAARLIINN